MAGGHKGLAPLSAAAARKPRSLYPELGASELVCLLIEHCWLLEPTSMRALRCAL